MNKEDAIKQLSEMSDEDCAENSHQVAEEILCEFLTDIGHEDLANEFEQAKDRVGFWYA